MMEYFKQSDIETFVEWAGKRYDKSDPKHVAAREAITKNLYALIEKWANLLQAQLFPQGPPPDVKKSALTTPGGPEGIQYFKKYLWAKIYPTGDSPKPVAYMVFFRVRAESPNGVFEVALDIQERLVSKEQLQRYDELRAKDPGSFVESLSPEQGVKLSLDELTKWAYNSIQNFLPYQELVNKLGISVSASDDQAAASLCLLATWNGINDREAGQVQASIKSRGAWASWWSFPIREEFHSQLKEPFYCYLNAGGERIRFRMKVERFETSRGNDGLETPWLEITDAQWLNKKRSGPKNSDVFKTWLYVTDIESLQPALTLDDFEGAPGVPRTALLNQSAFGYAYRKGAGVHTAQPAQGPRNVILYGPPGTGKTYKLRNEYMKRFTDTRAVVTPEQRAADLVRDLSWWEVIALALMDAPDQRSMVSQILEHPLVDARRNQSANRTPRAMLWAALQTHTKADCPNVKAASRNEPLIFWKDDTSTWSVDAKLAEIEVPALGKLLEQYRNPPTDNLAVSLRYKFTTFHQSFSYEDFIEGIKPQLDNKDDNQLEYEIRDGVFKEIVKDAKMNPSKDYALFIDEINRGNVAAIFGELITLIEEDKRLGNSNALEVTLPYSGKKFGVPKNLYIIGTMNTADRSVEALDTALRRRFTFIEMRPERDLVPELADLKVDLKRIFSVINARIEQLLDREHCIGHAYFMDVKDLSSLRSVFANKVLPLLQEYFYGNPAKVGMVLGDRFVTRTTGATAFATGQWGANDLDEKEVYSFADVTLMMEEDFISIYA